MNRIIHKFGKITNIHNEIAIDSKRSINGKWTALIILIIGQICFSNSLGLKNNMEITVAIKTRSVVNQIAN